MEFPASPPRARTFEIPKPETGLAEWTSKIKAMQRQVDADEEAEQKRLEDEIAASRLARLRRSHGPGYGSRTNVLDLSKSREYSSALGRMDNTTIDDMKPIAERQKSQADALHKLIGNSLPPNASATSPPIVQERSQVASPSLKAQSPPIQKKPESISLAAFMGGRATGPRLNRHAPQQDAHDPTQFEQRARVVAPHPVFGRGGVAMPGMAFKGRSSMSMQNVNQAVELPEAPLRSPERTFEPRDRRLSTPHAARRFPEKEEEHSVSPQKTGNRERTMSTPGGATTLARSTMHLQAQDNKPDLSRRPVSQPSIPDVRSKTPTQGGRYSHSNDLKAPSTSPPSASRPFTPRQQPSTSVSSPPKSPVTTTSLARPIRPEPRPSPQAPLIPHSPNPSPAFLRSPAQKDPTPSISRLQGRGFVQNMVKVSTQLESPMSSPSGMSEKSRVSSGRRASVLDRWQPTSSTSSTSATPQVSPKPIPMRKSRTVGEASMAAETPRSLKPVDMGNSVKTAASMSMSQVDIISPSAKPEPEPVKKKSLITSEATPGLGSANTMLAYTTKTDDSSPPSLEVNELGIRHIGAIHERTPYTTSELPAPSGKPLIHPTKDRARKPRKAKEETNGASKVERSLNIANVSVTYSLPQPSSVTPPPKLAESLAIPFVATTMPNTSPSPRLFKLQDQPLAAVPSLAPSSSNCGQIGRVTDKWVGHSIIGIKPVPSTTLPAQPESKSNGMVGRRALPGLGPTGQDEMSSRTFESSEPEGRRPLPTPILSSGGKSESTEPVARHPLPGLTSQISPPADPDQHEERSPTPGRHTRIPSTGNRATVMHVAQALSDQHHQSLSIGIENQAQPHSGPRLTLEQNTVKTVELIKPSTVTRPKAITPPIMQAEKRKSTYEKYSAIILPPLKEEATPVPSPAGSLLRGAGQPYLREQENGIPDAHTVQESLKDALYNDRMSPELKSSPDSDVVHFNHVDDPLPQVDIDSLVEARSHLVSSDENTQTISVDVMTITGTTAVAVSREPNVFYDTEVLAIIHRSKSKSSGLVATTVWGWRGKKCHFGEREERKLQDLSKRYGTSIVTVQQHSEPSELVSALGCQLAIRQGTRTHWTSENTAMHLVRSYDGVIFIDEHDLAIKNLCSGFSYCLSILDTLYVWYGFGSTAQERQAALEYAQGLKTTGASVIELTEGENDDDEMFWMVLGDDEFANADYWKWRRMATGVDPNIWRIDTSHNKDPVLPVRSFLEENHLSTAVFILDCVWELFVLVGREARGKRRDIRLAVSVAMELSARVATDRPYSPTIHVLVMPTQLPLDLRLNFRDLDEASLNNDHVPDHMNILSCEEALQHLRKGSWEKFALRDHTMLPLGLDSSNIP